MDRLRKAYDITQAAMLAIGIAILIMILLNIPHMRDATKQGAVQRELAVAQENREHCERFGLKVGDHSHVVCMIEVNRMREDSVRNHTATTSW